MKTIRHCPGTWTCIEQLSCEPNFSEYFQGEKVDYDKFRFVSKKVSNKNHNVLLIKSPGPQTNAVKLIKKYHRPGVLVISDEKLDLHPVNFLEDTNYIEFKPLIPMRNSLIYPLIRFSIYR